MTPGARFALCTLVITGYPWAAARAQPASSPAAATGSAPPRVLVREQGCAPQYEPAALSRLLELELAGLGLRAERMPDGEPEATALLADALALVEIECGPAPDMLRLRASDLASGTQLLRELSVADVSRDARPRVLALAVVSMLESSLAQAFAADAAGAPGRELPASVRALLRARLARRLAPPPAAPPPRPTAPIASAAAPGLRFDVDAVLRAFPGRSTGLIGIAFGVSPRLSRGLRLVLEADALYGSSELADAVGRKLGTMHLYWLAGGVGLGWSTPTLPELEIGPRVQAGAGLVDASARQDGASAHDEAGFVLCTLIEASLRLPLADGVWARIALDLGYAPVGVVFLAGQSRLLGMADTSFGLRTGLSF